ncbi:hypothetical protein CRYUN_Cryun07bG0105300 [Craigia yunnanensis]
MASSSPSPFVICNCFFSDSAWCPKILRYLSFNETDIQAEEGSLWGDSDKELDKASLDREWQKRHDQFHMIGYCDGLITGKEASAQQGFNIGLSNQFL